MYNKPLSAVKYLGQDLGRCTHPGKVLHQGGKSSFLEQKTKGKLQVARPKTFEKETSLISYRYHRLAIIIGKPWWSTGRGSDFECEGSRFES